ncbi:MAG: ATP-binding cassette domain-containing protein [Streptosporangiales bacterium]|nr:ATP-binding cassette domain-containing protein [Streptosporangiales bacterium]
MLDAELNSKYWVHRETVMKTGIGGLTRRLPGLIVQAARLAWEASPRETLIVVSTNLAAGVFTAFGLLATTGVLTALFADGATPHRVRAAIPSLLLVAGAAGARAGLQAIAGWAQARLRPQVDRIVEMRLFALTTEVDLVAFDDSDFHDSMQRARDRGRYEAPAVVSTCVDILTGLVGVAAAAGALGVLHPVLLPLLLAAAIPDGWAALRAARMRYMLMFQLSSSRRRRWILSDLMAERDPAAEVRAFSMRDFLLRRYDRIASHERDLELRLARRETGTRVAGDLMTGVATGVVYVSLGLLLAARGMPLAVAGTAVLAIRAGQGSLVAVLFSLNRCYESGLYFGDYLDFCERARGLRERRGRRPAPRGFTEIATEGVTFTYPDADKPSLHDVSVRVAAGEIVALVGENGSGKSTLAKILSGLYAPQQGEVLLDGVPYGTYEPDSLRDNVALIAQDHTHWPMTARDNITMGRAVDADRLATATTSAGADRVLEELPGGLDTLLDRRFKDGHELSGGQWQRMAVARGLYRDAPLLVCDEPTAALDARAEHALFEAVRTHAAGRTVLLITHRLASVRMADRIYVLDKGRVIEQGGHAELMAEDGVYAELYGLQARAYAGGNGVVPPPRSGVVSDRRGADASGADC